MAYGQKMPLDNKNYAGPDRRSQFRLEYSAVERPRILIATHPAYEVLNLSEGGVRFLRGASRDFKKDQAIVARIVFAANEVEDIQGKVLRVGEKTVTVRLTRKIPYQRYGRELIRIRRKVVLAG